MTVLLSGALAAEVTVDASAPIRSGDIGEARESAIRRALARAVESQTVSVSAQTLLRDGILTESSQVRASGCTESSEVIGESVAGNEITVRMRVMVREAGTCGRSCKHSTTNRVVIAGFPLEHPEQIGQTENSWLTNLTPSELARWLEKRKVVRSSYDERVFPYVSPKHSPAPNLKPDDLETPIAVLARNHRAQYVISGVYRDMGLRDKGLFGMTRRIEIEAYIHDGVNGAVVDSRIFSEEANGNVMLRAKPAVGSAEFYATDIGRAWGRVVNQIADWVTDKVSCLPFMTRVLKTEGEKIYLDAGAESGLAVGDTLILQTWRRPPAPVRGVDENVLGQEKYLRTTARIKYRYPEFAVAELVEAGHQITIEPGDLFYAR